MLLSIYSKKTNIFYLNSTVFLSTTLYVYYPPPILIESFEKIRADINKFYRVRSILGAQYCN